MERCRGLTGGTPQTRLKMHGKYALLLLEHEFVLGKLVEHLAETLILHGRIGAMHHDVIQIDTDKGALLGYH